MIDETLSDNEIETAADLGRQSAAADLRIVDVGHYEIEHVVGHITRDDETVEFEDLERLAARPRAQRGSVELHTPASFTEYLERLHTGEGTTVWAHLPVSGTPSLTAVFNDHGTAQLAGWRDHRALLKIPRDPDWLAWVALSEKPMTGTVLADFIEDHLHNIASPPAVRLIPAITTFTAKRNVEIEDSTDLRSGAVQFRYVENIEEGTKGDFELPREITLMLSPFLGEEPVEVKATLRFRIPRSNQERTTFAYRIVRADQVEREAFDRVCAYVVENGPSVPMLHGVAPAPLRS